MLRLFIIMMKLYIIRNYKALYPELKGRTLTDRLVGEILRGEKIEDPIIERTDRGKPYEKEGRRYFSVSHTGDVFGCLTSKGNVGLDIQHMRGVDSEGIAKRFFTEDEISYLMDNSDDMSAFYLIWTRKEALAKYTGTGIVGMNDQGSVLDRNDVSFTDFDIGDDTAACICTAPGTEESYEILFPYGE